MNQSEVEVLLRMRAEGTQALDMFNGKLDDVGKGGTRAAAGLGQAERKTKDTGVASTAAGVAVRGAIATDRNRFRNRGPNRAIGRHR